MSLKKPKAVRSDPKDIENALEVLRENLRARGLRNASSREAIDRVCLGYGGHFDANDLLRALRRYKVKDAHVASVYRTLPLLVEAGFIQPVLLSSGEGRFYERTFGRTHHD